MFKNNHVSFYVVSLLLGTAALAGLSGEAGAQQAGLTAPPGSTHGEPVVKPNPHAEEANCLAHQGAKWKNEHCMMPKSIVCPMVNFVMSPQGPYKSTYAGASFASGPQPVSGGATVLTCTVSAFQAASYSTKSIPNYPSNGMRAPECAPCPSFSASSIAGWNMSSNSQALQPISPVTPDKTGALKCNCAAASPLTTFLATQPVPAGGYTCSTGYISGLGYGYKCLAQ